jgi:hypothetical protein
VQHGASWRRESSLDMGKLQARANPCNTGIISRNEMRSAVRVRSSALSNRLRKRNTQNRSDSWEQVSADCGSEGRRFESRCSPQRQANAPYASISSTFLIEPSVEHQIGAGCTREVAVASMFAGVAYRLSTMLILPTVGTENAPYRVSMALYRWGSGCITAQ